LLEKVIAACEKNYNRFPNVVGMGIGTKYIEGRSIDNSLCVQFFVKKKIKKELVNQILPGFVYARDSNGKVDYSDKICTDVIEVADIELMCKSGDPIYASGEKGTATLVFQNKSHENKGYYLITCSHVAGSIWENSKKGRFGRTHNGKKVMEAEIIFNSQANKIGRKNVLEYDIALAKILENYTPQPDLEVLSGNRISKILSRVDIYEKYLNKKKSVSCARSGANIKYYAEVMSCFGCLDINIDNHNCRVRNLWAINERPRPGDSGGLIYDGDAAIGILVARGKNGYGYFQLLHDSLDYLNKKIDFSLQCFK